MENAIGIGGPAVQLSVAEAKRLKSNLMSAEALPAKGFVYIRRYPSHVDAA